MIYGIARVLAFLVLMPLFFIKVVGRKNFKVEGGCLVICNHKSNWDPIVLGFSNTYRPVGYMAKEELFRSKPANFFLRRLHAIPISRGKGDIGAVKAALKALRAGETIGIFPEGTRSKTGELLPFGQGAALFALKTEVPVVPVYISGDYKLFRRVVVKVHRPIYLSQMYEGSTTSETITEATRYLEDIMKEMSRENA